jgi:hypothetical protein
MNVDRAWPMLLGFRLPFCRHVRCHHVPHNRALAVPCLIVNQPFEATTDGMPILGLKTSSQRRSSKHFLTSNKTLNT